MKQNLFIIVFSLFSVILFLNSYEKFYLVFSEFFRHSFYIKISYDFSFNLFVLIIFLFIIIMFIIYWEWTKTSGFGVYNLIRIWFLLRFSQFFGTIFERIYSVIIFGENDFVDIPFFLDWTFRVFKSYKIEELFLYFHNYKRSLKSQVLDLNNFYYQECLDFLDNKIEFSHLEYYNKFVIREKIDLLLLNEVNRLSQLEKYSKDTFIIAKNNNFDDFLSFLSEARYGLAILGISIALFIYVIYFEQNRIIQPELSFKEKLVAESAAIAFRRRARWLNATHNIEGWGVWAPDHRFIRTLYRYVDKRTERPLDPSKKSKNGVWIPYYVDDFPLIQSDSKGAY